MDALVSICCIYAGRTDVFPGPTGHVKHSTKPAETRIPRRIALAGVIENRAAQPLPNPRSGLDPELSLSFSIERERERDVKRERERERERQEIETDRERHDIEIFNSDGESKNRER